MSVSSIIDVTRDGIYDMSIENPAVPMGVADDYMYGTYTYASDSGVSVTPMEALGVAAVWQAVTMISSSVAKLPLHMYRRGPNDTRVRERFHEAAVMVGKQPNPMMTPFKFWRRVMSYQLLWNRAYVWIDRTGKRPRLWPIHPTDMQLTMDNGSGEMVYAVNMGSSWLQLYRDEMLVFEGLCIEDESQFQNTRKLIDYARNAFGLALAQQRYANRFFRQGGRIGGVLELPVAMTKQARDNIETGFRKTYESVDAAFKTIVLRDNAKFHSGQFAPDQAQLVEGRKEQVKDIARYFNLSPSRLGEENSSSYGSKAEDNRDYLDTTLSPHLCQIAEECEAKLLLPREFIADDMYFEHNTDALLRLDALGRAQQYDYLRRNNIISPNEARRRENLPLRTDPGGDAYDNPNTTTNTDSNVVQAKAERMCATLLAATLERTIAVCVDKIKRASDSGNKFEAWIDASLPMAVLAVTDACAEVLNAYADVCDRNAVDLSALLHATLLRDMTGKLHGICDTTPADSLRFAVSELFDGFAATTAASMTRRIIGDQAYDRDAKQAA